MHQVVASSQSPRIWGPLGISSQLWISTEPVLISWGPVCRVQRVARATTLSVSSSTRTVAPGCQRWWQHLWGGKLFLRKPPREMLTFCHFITRKLWLEDVAKESRLFFKQMGIWEVEKGMAKERELYCGFASVALLPVWQLDVKAYSCIGRRMTCLHLCLEVLRSPSGELFGQERVSAAEFLYWGSSRTCFVA